MALQAASLYATVSVAGADRSVRDLGRVSGATDAAMRKFTVLGRSSGGIGKGFGQMLGGVAKVVERTAAVIVAAGVGAGVIAMNMQDAFAGIKKTVEGTPQELDKLNDSLKRLSTRIPVSYQDLAIIATEAGALNVAAADVDRFTEAVSRTVAATVGLDTAVAAEAFGKLGTIFSLHGKDFERLGSVLVELGRNGASTEADIIAVTQRFSAAGQAAGLSAAQVLGWSSALASLGPEAEAAGGALSRVFSRLTQNIALMGQKDIVGKNALVRVKTFAKVAGVSVKEFSDLYRKDASGALDLFLVRLGKLDKFQAAAALRRAGIVNQRDIFAIYTLAQHTKVLNDQLAVSDKAWADGNALLTVSATRFDTAKAKVFEFWNALKLGADAFGEEVLPQIGRLADRAKALVLTHLADFRNMGKEVAQAIEGIDWSRVEDGLRTVADLSRGVLGIIRMIPGEVSVAFLGLVGLDKLSGGLLGKGAGNVIGGVFNQFLARGASAANPMWVAPVGGGLGGVAGGAGATSALGKVGAIVGKVFIVGMAAGAIAELAGVLGAQSTANRQAATDLTEQTKTYAGIATLPQIMSSLQGIEQYQWKLSHSWTPEGIAYAFNIDGVRDALDKQATILRMEATYLARAQERGWGPPRKDTLTPADFASAVSTSFKGFQSSALGIYEKSAAARGIKFNPNAKPSTSITPRLNFLASNAPAAKIVDVAHALTTHFLRSNAPLYTSTKNIERTIAVLKADQARFAAHGDTINAAKIGADIEALERKINGGLTDVEKQARATAAAARATAQAIKDKDLTVHVTNQPPKDTVNPTDFEGSVSNSFKGFQPARSTPSITPRLTALASTAPLYNSSKNIERTIAELRADQARFAARGDTSTAARIGADIAALERTLHGGLTAVEAKEADAAAAARATAQAVKDKDLTVHVNNPPPRKDSPTPAGKDKDLTVHVTTPPRKDTLTPADFAGAVSNAFKGFQLSSNAKPTMSITPRVNFMSSAATQKIVDASHDLASHLLRSSRPLYSSTRNIERTIAVLRGDQARFAARGDVRNAAKIGADIDQLERTLAGRLAEVKQKEADTAAAARATAQAVRDKDLSVHVQNPVFVYLNGKRVYNALLQYQMPAGKGRMRAG